MVTINFGRTQLAKSIINQKFRFYFVSLVPLLFFSASAHAARIEPLSIVNTSPVILVHSRPAASSAAITPKDDLETSFIYEISSHFNQESSSKETVIFDGETTRLELSVKKGLGRDTDLELRVPFYDHDGGSLDGFIEDWHDLFGLPQNHRDDVAHNRLLYFYRYQGETRLLFQEPASGMGDVQLIFTRELLDTANEGLENLSLKLAVKLPTGDASKLTGSESLSVSAWLTGDRQTSWFDVPGRTYASLGVMVLEEGEVLSQQQNNFVAFGSLGTGIVVNEMVSLQTQLDASTPFYDDSDFEDISGFTLQLTLGGNLRFGDGLSLDLGVVEDLSVHASPDVILHMNLRGRF